MVGDKFYFIYSKDYVPDRVDIKVRKILGHRAIGMTGEKRTGPNEFSGFANTAFLEVYRRPKFLRYSFYITTLKG
jgi:hypothetical protein